MSMVPANAVAASPMGNLAVRTDAQGVRWVTIPTASTQNRTFMITLSINVQEREIAYRPSRDVEMRLNPGEDVAFLLARIIRREGYFRAILVQSRGQAAPACNKCSTGTNKFQACTRIHDYQDGACGE